MQHSAIDILDVSHHLKKYSLSEALTRFKDLLQKVHHHGIDLWLQVQKFYDHVNPVTRRIIDQSAGGKLRDLNAEESWALLEDLVLYDNERRIDIEFVVGGFVGVKWYTFKPEQNNLGDTYNPSWKSHPKLRSEPKDNKEVRGSSSNRTIQDSLSTPDSISFIHHEKSSNSIHSLNRSGLVPPSPNAALVCTKEEDGDVMFIEIIPKDDSSHKEEPEAEVQEVEYFDIFSTRSELTSVMSSALSVVTYTSVYTNSESGRAFWGADDVEISEGGIAQARGSSTRQILRTRNERGADVRTGTMILDSDPRRCDDGDSLGIDADGEDEDVKDEEEEGALSFGRLWLLLYLLMRLFSTEGTEAVIPPPSLLLLLGWDYRPA
ncbi:hypothetical protein Tco_0807172 [Tanacetum coccineum]